MLINPCYAAKSFKILVIPSNIFEDYTNYMIYSKSDEVIANDVINYYKKNAIMSAPSVTYVKDVLNQPQNINLKKSTVKLLNNYRTNYTINYADVQKLSSKFNINNVLLITTNLDAQNYFMRRTFWDFINMPGATTIDPAYRLSTQVTLIDANNQIILWQQNYQKLISSRENRIIPEAFSPNAEQLEKVKKYSTHFLAPQVVQETQLALLNMSPYQNLNIHPEIEKPKNISIDKFKIDSQRASVKTGRAIKKGAMGIGGFFASIGRAIVGKSSKKLSNVKTPKVNTSKLKKATKKTIKNTQQNINNVQQNIQNNTNNLQQNINNAVKQTKDKTNQAVKTITDKPAEQEKVTAPINQTTKINDNKTVEQEKTSIPNDKTTKINDSKTVEKENATIQNNQTINKTVEKTVKPKKGIFKKKQKANKNKSAEQEKIIAPINQTTEQETNTNVKENLQNEKDINTILKENNIQIETKTIIRSPLDNMENMKPYIRISPEIQETNYTINDL